MGWSQSHQVCQSHPYHNLNHGVCASCLREKLSELSVSSPIITDHPSSPISAGFSTPSSQSNRLSPEHNRCRGLLRHHHRHGSTGSLSFRVKNVDGLNKSRSVAFVRSHAGEGKNGKGKRGFWSKLLYWKGKKEGLTHPGNVKEMLC